MSADVESAVETCRWDVPAKYVRSTLEPVVGVRVSGIGRRTRGSPIGGNFLLARTRALDPKRPYATFVSGHSSSGDPRHSAASAVTLIARPGADIQAATDRTGAQVRFSCP
jgi:hypothetical protein